MLQVSEAREKLLQSFIPGNIESVLIDDACGRVLAESIRANEPSPLFTQSSMDGLAVVSENLLGAGENNPVALEIVGKAAAGHQETISISDQQAVLIMTGAPLPTGADAVVRVEDTNLDFDSEEIPTEALIYQSVRSGENVRSQGENYPANTLAISSGKVLGPQDVGMLAMLGRAEVSVYQHPLVGIFSSGDELVAPGSDLGFGKKWNSNSYMLAALIKQCGGAVLDLGIVSDNMPGIISALDEFKAAGVALILTSGGVSMGTHDYVRRVLEDYGKLDFWKVNMRPGKPLAFGSYSGIPFAGLPGNPVSSFVGFNMFVCPAIQKMSGIEKPGLILSKARLEQPLESDGRESYLPGIVVELEKGPVVSPIGNQSSGNLFSLVQANCLIKIAPGVQSLKQDSIVEIWKLS